jgi:hypothetical protein
MSEPEPTTPEPVAPAAPTTPEPVTSWMETAGLDTDLQSNPSITKFKDVPSLAKSYIELQTTLGADRIALPGKEAKPEEWDAVYNRLGRPDTADGYELSDWKPPEGVPWDMDNTGTMIERMHARRLTKEQAQGLLADQAEVADKRWKDHLENVGKMREQTVTELKTKYGAALPVKMESGKKAAIAIVEKAGLSENPFEQELPDGRKVGDLPGMVEVMMAFGEAVGEDGSPGPGARTTRTPEEAQRELNEMFGDSKKMGILTDASHPEHKALQARKTALERQIYA